MTEVCKNKVEGLSLVIRICLFIELKISSQLKDRFKQNFRIKNLRTEKIFLISLLKDMATEGMKQLIDYARADEEINEALMDITEFKLGLLNRMSIDDLLCIEEAVFKFSGRSLTQRR